MCIPKQLRVILLLALMVTMGPAIGAGPQRLVAPLYVTDNINSGTYYYARLLHLALEKTVEDYGAYELVLPDALFVDDRLKAAIMQGYVDVSWFSTTPETEQQLRAIRVPLLGEINQYRLLLIREEDQPRFAQVETLEDLRGFVGGLSEQWPEAEVLVANDLPFVSTTGYSRLFQMLAAGRFDYFARGLYQIAGEIEHFPELGLVIEKTLMLAYPSHMYFFVHPDNTRLAERIETGLLRARADGSWQALFESVPRLQWAHRALQQHQRRILPLSLD